MADLPIPAGFNCGCLPRKTAPGEVFPRASEVIEPLTRDELIDLIDADDAVDLSPNVTRIKDQNGTNGCSSNATTQVEEMAHKAVAPDSPFVEFSAASVYKQCNGGRDAGSSIDDNLEVIATTGPLPVDGTEGYAHTFPRNDWRHALPRGWEETAALFRAKEWWDLDGVLEACTALVLGFPIVVGVWWTARSGHALAGARAVRNGRTLGIRIPNSWGPDWGDHGFGTLWEDKLEAGIRSFGAWALRVQTPRENSLPPAPYLEPRADHAAKKTTTTRRRPRRPSGNRQFAAQGGSRA